MSGPDVEHERDPQQQPAEQVHVIAEGIEAREGGRARAEHQRDDVDRDAFHHRHGEQEHHRRAVHGEQLVVALRADQVAVGPRQLQRAWQREHAAEREEDQRGDDVAAADLLVVDGREPADDPGRAAPGALEPRLELRALELRAVARDLLALAGEPLVFRSDRARARSFERLEISDDGVQLVGLEPDRRHLVAGLDRLRVGDPAVEIALAHRHRAGGDASGGWRDG